MSNAYKNIILTNHTEERMALRRISREMILSTVQKPDSQEKEADGDTQFVKTINKRPLHVVAAYLKDEKKWLIKTVWVRGEDDPQPLWKRLLRLLGIRW